MNAPLKPVDMSVATGVLLLRASMRGWPAEESSFIRGWYRRASSDMTKRCNSVWPLRTDYAADITADIKNCEKWYRARDKPAIFQINSKTALESLDDELAARGYAELDPSCFMVLDLAGMATNLHPPFIHLQHRPTAIVINAICPPDMNAAKRLARAKLLNRIRKPVAFAVACPSGEPVAGGMAVVDGQFTGIFSMYTHAAARRRGLARKVLLELIKWSRNMGARLAYLQIENANMAAATLYRSVGFVPAFNYHYRLQSDPV